jgi:Caspase domain
VTDPVDGTRNALIVASDQYADPGLQRLRAPAVDARALAEVLRDPGIGGFEVRTLLNEPAHTVNLAVEDFFADRRPGDLLLVHFSGHGVKDEEGELYFAAPDTALGRLGSTAVAAEFVSRRMNRSRSRRVVLLLDCCYAGAFERGMGARAGVDMGIEQQFGGRGRAVITASSAMEYAFEAGELVETRELSPSVFTGALVQGLATGDADQDQDGQVGRDELYDYVYDKVRAATPNQTPGKWVFGLEGELYIARRSRPVTTPAPLPPELQQAIDSPLAGVRAGAVQELAHVLRGSHAGMALTARLALEKLSDDDSRAVAAAATAALGAPVPVPRQPALPELALSATVIDLGRLPQHGQSPEHRVRISNAGGGNLNAQAATSAAWLKLRRVGDELAVAMDTSAAGEYEGTITVDSGSGTATIRVHAQVAPARNPEIEIGTHNRRWLLAAFLLPLLPPLSGAVAVPFLLFKRDRAVRLNAILSAEIVLAAAPGLICGFLANHFAQSPAWGSTLSPTLSNTVLYASLWVACVVLCAPFAAIIIYCAIQVSNYRQPEIPWFTRSARWLTAILWPAPPEA